MTHKRLNFRHISLVALGCVCGVGAAFAASAPNPRTSNTTAPINVVSTSDTSTSARSAARVTARAPSADTSAKSVVATRSASTATATRANSNTVSSSRAATSTAARTASRSATTTATARAATNTVTSTSATARSSIRQKVTNALGRIGRAATPGAGVVNVSRAATSGAHIARSASASSARSATSKSYISRAGSSRATAVFSDVSKIGGGYAECRDAYNTCMDQLCAIADESVGRCYCSSRYDELNDTKSGIEEALEMLQNFENNNLMSVTLSAGEAGAMYQATAGEAAVGTDTSAAAQMLADISDLLSGKKKAVTNTNSLSLGIMDGLFSTNFSIDWDAPQEANSLFSTSSSTDFSRLTGQKLYNSASESCLAVLPDSCTGSVLNLVRSSYNVLITQSCTAYEKTVNSGRTKVEAAVRNMEKALREARLEEYQAHNSADVNECMTKVKAAITDDVVCGENYKKCLDNTGRYVDSNGTANLTPGFLNLKNQINLYTTGDILAVNKDFNEFLENKRMFVTSALDTCRDISETVWTEFKRSAMIEISQAQDSLIEEVKSSCVETMSECYDKQTGALTNFGGDSVRTTGADDRLGAMGAYAARAMCREKVDACVMLYGTGDCFNEDGTIDEGKRDTCGLGSLMDFVDTIDQANVSDACLTAVNSWLSDQCTPPKSAPAGQNTYPYGCKDRDLSELYKGLDTQIELYCADPSYRNVNSEEAKWRQYELVIDAITDIKRQLENGMFDVYSGLCESYYGTWYDPDETAAIMETKTAEQRKGQFMPEYYAAIGASIPTKFTASDLMGEQYVSSVLKKQGDKDTRETILGHCLKADMQYECERVNDESSTKDVAKYDPVTKVCNLSETWYQQKCAEIGGSYYMQSDGKPAVCYVKQKSN